MLTEDVIQKINGFPNRMFGWGGEDDDIYARYGWLLLLLSYTTTRSLPLQLPPSLLLFLSLWGVSVF